MNDSTVELMTGAGPREWVRQFIAILLVGVILGFAQGCATTRQPTTRVAATDESQAETFASPDDAARALIAALSTNDQEQLHKIFGSAGDKIISSGDAVADRRGREKFLQAYEDRHELVTNSNGSMTLVVGNKQWPSPIPVTENEKSKRWSFDARAGEEEILNRRIGRNELTVIQVCQAIADAQREYAHRDPDGDGIENYAQKFISDPGKKNGLYWKTGEGETPSPLGALVTTAVDEGYTSKKSSTGARQPYQGYFFRMLKSQGPNAPGGAYDYIINGQMIGGFAVLAYPAQYGNSGIMTFMVDSQGTVYQKDLGKDTKQAATAMKAFDPDSSWQKAEAPLPE